MSNRRLRSSLAALLALGVLAACSSGSPSPSSSPSPSPSQSPSPSPAPTPSASTNPSPSPTPSPVTTAAEAVARVLASDPHFAGIGPHLLDVIGQSSWYEVQQVEAGWVVTIRIGWGDCPAGCINSHRWQYGVSVDGTVTFMGEDGDPIEGAIPTPDVTGTGSLDIHVVAGPTCPVETNPPQPGCEPRDVVGATVIIRDANGVEVARTVSDDTGHARADLPAGIYVVSAEDLQGYMGMPEPVAVWALHDSPGLATLEYDTGIR